MFKKTRALIGISGGPDSIYLFETYKKKYDFIICHINYNKRKSSIRDTKIVRDIAKKNDLPYYELNCDKKIYDEYKAIKNFQAKARKIRYDFFKKISKKEEVNLLFLGHHKDDFIETAIMQEKRSSNYFFYGIKRYGEFEDIEIYRPLLKRYKAEIFNYLNDMDILYGLDETNDDPKYERNKIRKNLESFSTKEKDKLYKHFVKLNRANQGRNKMHEKIFNEWKDKNYDINYFKQIDKSYTESIVFKFLIESPYDFNINRNKLLGIIEFINSNKGKRYRISEDIYLFIENKKLIII